MYSRRFSPFQDLETIREQINQAFEPMVRTVVQEAAPVLAIPFELTETSAQYVLKACVPGLAPDKIDVQATGKSLTISAEYPPREFSKDEYVHLREFRAGKVRRTLEFDENIITEGIQANYQNGILILTLPKVEAKKDQSIKVEIKPS